jgi:hypothetical protein
MQRREEFVNELTESVLFRPAQFSRQGSASRLSLFPASAGMIRVPRGCQGLFVNLGFSSGRTFLRPWICTESNATIPANASVSLWSLHGCSNVSSEADMAVSRGLHARFYPIWQFSRPRARSHISFLVQHYTVTPAGSPCRAERPRTLASSSSAFSLRPSSPAHSTRAESRASCLPLQQALRGSSYNASVTLRWYLSSYPAIRNERVKIRC